MFLYPRHFLSSISFGTLPATISMNMNNICFNTHRILDDVDSIVADNVEPAMHADIDAENAHTHTPESILIFSTTKYIAMFNIKTEFVSRWAI